MILDNFNVHMESNFIEVEKLPTESRYTNTLLVLTTPYMPLISLLHTPFPKKASSNPQSHLLLRQNTSSGTVHPQRFKAKRSGISTPLRSIIAPSRNDMKAQNRLPIGHKSSA